MVVGVFLEGIVQSKVAPDSLEDAASDSLSLLLLSSSTVGGAPAAFVACPAQLLIRKEMASSMHDGPNFCSFEVRCH